MKLPLNIDNIKKATEQFSNNNHFRHIALPRLLSLCAIKKALRNIPDIKWLFEYNFTNINSNRVIIEYQPAKSSELNLFYEIPLSQKFEFRAFLGISSAHFLDIYNYLINNNIIKENQFTLRAEYHTIPHFVLNQCQRYNVGLLSAISTNWDMENNIDFKIKEEIEKGIEQFQPIFKTIIAHFKL